MTCFRVHVLTVALCLATLPARPAAPEPPARRALLIGINDYAAVTSLHGCLNDVEDMRRLLASKYGFPTEHITVLRNREATRAGILAALSSLIAQTGSNDVVVIHYSGHGSRMRDRSHDESDGWDETIVPQDSRQAGIFDISDDELNVSLRQLAARTPNITVILDSCHSGSATRGGAVSRRVPDDLRTPPAEAEGSPDGESATIEMAAADIPYTLITGCRPHELSNEYDVGFQRRGALTYFLTGELRKAPAGMTFRDLRDRLRDDVSAIFPTQHPQIEGPKQDSLIFGDAEVPGAPYYLVRSATGAVTVDGGDIDGLTGGTRLAVYPPGSKSFPEGEAIAQIELTTVTSFTSTAKTSDARAVPDFGRAVVVRSAPGSFALRVLIDGEEKSAVLRQVRRLLGGEKGVLPVSDAATAHVTAREKDGAIQLLHADLTEHSPRVPAGEASAAEHVVSQLQQWRAWYALAARENPNAVVPLQFSIRVNGKELGGLAEVAEGEKGEFTVTNTSSSPVYFALFDLSADGSIAPLYPRHGEEETLAPGHFWKETFRFKGVAGQAVSEGVLKLIASDEPIPVARYLQAAVKTVEPEGASLWSALQRRVRVRRPVRAVGFIIHDPQPAGATRAARAGDTLGNCGEPGGCYELRPFGPAGLVEAVPAGRGTTEVVKSLGAIWDEAYRLKREANAAAVEPSLDVDLSGWEEDDVPPSARSGAGEPPKPGAVADDEWSLKHVNAAAAWNMLRAGGRRDGEEGASVAIAHIDTGYRRHPEIWSADPARTTVLPAEGYDFLDSDDDPIDEMDDSGLLPNPGHGTKSGSTIASPKGAQYAAPNGRHVTGVAPGAHLIPIRVHRSVVHFNSTRLGRAIFEAAGPDRTHIKQPSQVISISMGGLPSWTLWKAVRYARERGDIVVSAAGNNVGFVVWPARFRETIAVAATNVNCGIWSGSSRGEAVDIAAPGESVWHAEVDPAGGNIIDMGSGTTYATATVAGIAALWLDQHRSDPALRQLRERGEITDAFRAALRASAWVPAKTSLPPNVTCVGQTPWNAAETGAGIADAAKTLAQPLPASPSRGARAVESAGVPLFGSLFPAGASGDDVEQLYRRLLKVPSTAATATVADLEGEIVHQYALNDAVRRALDAVVQSESPTDEQLESARAALRQGDISDRLRQALT